jgi:hypothetical protein
MKDWMRYEQASIWVVAIIVLLMVLEAIACYFTQFTSG